MVDSGNILSADDLAGVKERVEGRFSRLWKVNYSTLQHQQNRTYIWSVNNRGLCTQHPHVDASHCFVYVFSVLHRWIN